MVSRTRHQLNPFLEAGENRTHSATCIRCKVTLVTQYLEKIKVLDGKNSTVKNALMMKISRKPRKERLCIEVAKKHFIFLLLYNEN